VYMFKFNVWDIGGQRGIALDLHRIRDHAW
jgi:hypothetical protein